MIKLYLSNSPFEFSEEAYAHLAKVLADFEQTFIEYDYEPAKKMVKLERNLVLQLQNLLATESDKLVTMAILEKAIDSIDESFTRIDKEKARQAKSEERKAEDNYDKAISRDESQALMGGVCAGLANYFKLSVVLVRACFIGLSLMFFFPIILYLFLWMILPKETSPTQQVFNATHAKDLKNKVSNFLMFNKKVFIRAVALVFMIPLIIVTVSMMVGTAMFLFSDNIQLDIHSEHDLPYFIEMFINLSKWDILVVLILVILVFIYLIKLTLILFKEERLAWNGKFALILGILLILGTSKVTLFRSGADMVHEQSESFNQESQMVTLDARYKDIFLELEQNANKRRTIPFAQAGDYIYVKIKRKRRLENIQIKLKVLSRGSGKMRLTYPLRMEDNVVYLPDFLMGKRRGSWIEKKVEVEICLPRNAKVEIGDELRANSRFIFIRE